MKLCLKYFWFVFFPDTVYSCNKVTMLPSQDQKQAGWKYRCRRWGFVVLIGLTAGPWRTPHHRLSGKSQTGHSASTMTADSCSPTFSTSPETLIPLVTWKVLVHWKSDNNNRKNKNNVRGHWGQSVSLLFCTIAAVKRKLLKRKIQCVSVLTYPISHKHAFTRYATLPM